MRFISIVIVGIVIGVGLVYFLLLKGNGAAAWYSDNWKYRTEYIFDGPENINKKVFISIDTSALISAGKMQSDCGDSRFTDSKGSELQYYIDTSNGDCDTNDTHYYILVPEFNASSTSVFHYYGSSQATNGTQVSQFSEENYPQATGGTITSVGSDVVHTFTSSGTFAPSISTNVQSLVVAGGGSGGGHPVIDRTGGGGGAGGVQYNASVAITPQDYSISVGVGGTNNSNGQDSSALGTTSTGGGYGADGAFGGTVGNGGSGGGSTHRNLGVYGTGIAGQGYRGGTQGYDSGNGSTGSFAASGGGGAGAVGDNGTSSPSIHAGDGGVGLAYDISGISTYYGGGGGGGVQDLGQGGTAGSGGLGGGGNGAVNGNGSDATPNTGGGGGGGGSNGNGGAGGSGIVIVRYTMVSAQNHEETRKTGPVAYWSFDEGYGTSVRDSSSNSYTGTLSGVEWKGEEDCVFGKCLYFDGTSNITFASGPNIESEVGTISFWMRYMGDATTDAESAIYSTADDATRFEKSYQTDGWNMSLDNRQYGSGAGVIARSTWHHIALTWDVTGRERNMYIDGKLYTSNTDFLSAADTAALTRIGSRGGDTKYFEGFLDEFKVYDYVRTSDEIKQDYTFGSAKGSSVVLGAQDQSFLSQGLIGYWKMDGIGSTGSGVSVLDNSGNSNTGTTSGGVSIDCTGIGKYGKGCNFDGNNDYISVTQSDSINITNDISIALWLKTSTTNTGVVGSTFISKDLGGCGSGVQDWFANVRNNKAVFWTSGTACTAVTSNTSVNDGLWHHIVLTRDQDTGLHSIYIDGIFDNSNTGNTGSIYNTTDLYIGSLAANSNVFPGQLDEVRIYNKVLTGSEVNSLYEWAPGPITYWDFDEGTGTTTVNDKSGNGNDGTMGSAMTENSWVQGKYGNALYFGGNNNEFVRNTTSGGVNGLPQFTAEVWLQSDYWDAAHNNESIPFYMGVGSGLGGMRYLPGSERFQVDAVIGGNTYYNGSGTYPTDSNWHHVAYVYDGTNLTWYVDGAITSQNATSGGLVQGTDAVSVGASNVNSRHFEGSVDEMRIYNYARTQKQILQDMNAGHPTVGTPIGSTVLHLSMDEGYGTTVHDKSPEVNNGTLGTGSSAPSWTNDGKWGKALSFDGTNDYVSMSNISFTAADSWTASLWLREDDGESGWSFFLGRNGTTTESILYSSTTDQLQFRTDDTSYIGGPSVVRNQWNHAVVTYDNGTIYIYLNGKQYGPYTKSTTMIFNAIGAAYNDDHYFKGKIDEVKIYPVALTAEQVLQDYQGGKAMVFGAQSTGVGGSSPSNSSARSYCIPGDTSTCNAPVLELNFEEATGQIAYDTSTNGNNWTLGANTSVGSDDPVWSLGPDHMAGSALQFDGSEDYAFVADSTSLDYSAMAASTVSVWVKAGATTSTDKTVYGHWYGGANRRTFSVNQQAGNKWECRTNDGDGSAISISSVTPNQWYLITCVWESSTSLKTYVNGALETTDSTVEATLDGNSAIHTIGVREKEGAFDQYFNGSVDGLKVYNYARTPAQIAWEYSKGAPIVHYRLDECQGTTAYNSAFSPSGAAGNNGTINAGSSGNTSAGTCTSGSGTEMWANGALGKWSSSLDFDETDDRLVIPDMALGQEFTVSFWFNSEDNTGTGYQYMYSHGTIQTANSLNIYFNEDSNAVNTPGAILVSVMDSDDGIPLLSQDVQTQVGLSDSTWHHLVVTITSSGTKAYVDGVQQISYSNGNGGLNPSGDIYIGARNDLNSLRFYDGKLDDIRIYNYPLTTTQIKELYKGGAVVFK